MLYPLTFQPIFKERVWGGRNLERLYRKALPPGVPIGESWEITDRPEAASVVADGPLAGKDLRWLMEQHSKELLEKEKVSVKKVSVNGIDIFLLEAQEAAWLASYQWNIRARFITS